MGKDWQINYSTEARNDFEIQIIRIMYKGRNMHNQLFK